MLYPGCTYQKCGAGGTVYTPDLVVFLEEKIKSIIQAHDLHGIVLTFHSSTYKYTHVLLT